MRSALDGPTSIPPLPQPDPYSDPIAVALIELIFEQGYEAVDEDSIIERAKATAPDFWCRFADKQDCTIKTVAACLQELEWITETAYRTGNDWQESLRAAAWAVADFIEERPVHVHVIVIDLLQARNEMLRVLREEVLMYGARLVGRGRAAAPDPDAVPAGADLIVMGSIAQLLTHRLQKGVDVAPYQLVRQLLYLAVRLFIGEEAAREEFVAPRPSGSWVRRPAPVSRV